MDKRQRKAENPFEEYMWMGDMDTFDKQVQEQLLEEDFIRQCIEQLLEEEEERETVSAEEIIHQKNIENKKSRGDEKTSKTAVSSSHNGRTNGYTNGYDVYNNQGFRNDGLPIIKSNLNPNAKVFVPQGMTFSTS